MPLTSQSCYDLSTTRKLAYIKESVPTLISLSPGINEHITTISPIHIFWSTLVLQCIPTKDKNSDKVIV
ncbi:hypothetical protein, partial [Escherichia coli]|uniref:hypothetical protein n=1 Tax=Escherichia coli TaxID=562 RepID=UPI001F4ACA1F